MRGKPGRVTHQIPGPGRIRFKWKRMFPRKLHDRLVKHQTSAISSQQPWLNWSTSAGFIGRGEISCLLCFLSYYLQIVYYVTASVAVFLTFYKDSHGICCYVIGKQVFSLPISHFSPKAPKPLEHTPLHHPLSNFNISFWHSRCSKPQDSVIRITKNILPALVIQGSKLTYSLLTMTVNNL